VLLGAISLPISLTENSGRMFRSCRRNGTVYFLHSTDASGDAPFEAGPTNGRRDAIYDNLRDLRFEYRAGKYSEADFEAMKTAMETEAALVLAEIDQVTDAGVNDRRPAYGAGMRPAMKRVAFYFAAALAILTCAGRSSGNRSRHGE
jgi:hypothetical protein